MRTEKHLFLERDDLLPLAKNTPTSDICIGFFKNDIIKSIMKSNLVLFIDNDNDEMKIIKSRYIIYNE